MIIASVKDFGALIRTARKKVHMNQAQLAAASGVGERFIRDLEKGKPSCQLEKALLVARMLGIKFDAILPPTINEKTT